MDVSIIEPSGLGDRSYLVSDGAGDDVGYQRRAVGDGEIINAEPIQLQVMHTPVTPTPTSATSCATPPAPPTQSSPAARCSSAPPAAPTSSAVTTPRN